MISFDRTEKLSSYSPPLYIICLFSLHALKPLTVYIYNVSLNSQYLWFEEKQRKELRVFPDLEFLRATWTQQNWVHISRTQLFPLLSGSGCLSAFPRGSSVPVAGWGGPQPATSTTCWINWSLFLCAGISCSTDSVYNCVSWTLQLSSWLIPAASTRLNISSMTPSELSALSGLLPQLGASFLLPLTSQRLLEILSKPGFHAYSPAQVSREGELLHTFSYPLFCSAFAAFLSVSAQWVYNNELNI